MRGSWARRKGLDQAEGTKRTWDFLVSSMGMPLRVLIGFVFYDHSGS